MVAEGVVSGIILTEASFTAIGVGVNHFWGRKNPDLEIESKCSSHSLPEEGTTV